MMKKKRFKLGIQILVGMILLFLLTILFVFRNEIRTILSINKINDIPVYEVNYRGDYELDKYLNTGSESYAELLHFINQNLGKGVGRYIYEDYGCSSFFAETPEGDYILGRNLDTSVAIPSIIRTDTKDTGKTIGMSNLIWVGWNEENPISKLAVISSPYFTFDGMNEYGVAVCSLSVPITAKASFDNDKITLHDLTVNRVVIDKAKSVTEAIDLLSNYNIKMSDHYPSHYMIADAKGNSVVIEYIDGDMKVINNDKNYQIATNFILYKNEDLRGYSSVRYHAFDEVLSQTKGIISEESAMDLLKKNVIPGEAQWSVVYNLTKKTMAVEFSGDYDNTYYYSMTY